MIFYIDSGVIAIPG